MDARVAAAANHAQSSNQLSQVKRSGQRLALATLCMFGVTFLLVPLYEVFCDWSGLNRGDIQLLAGSNTQVVSSRTVEVALVAQNQKDSKVRLTAPQGQSAILQTHPGELINTEYVIENTSNEPLTVRAVPSFFPLASAQHFKKIECFCFRDVMLLPGEQRRLPLIYVLDQQMPEWLGSLTLSYAVFVQQDAAANNNALSIAAHGSI